MAIKEIKIDIYSEALDRTATENARSAEAKASKILLRRVFGEKATLVHDSDGRPSVAGVDFMGMISISHSLTTYRLAVTHDPGISIGIDVETWREQLKRVAPKFLTADEQKFYVSPQSLLLAWTTKEAVYKAVRIPGLALKEIQLPLPVPESASFTATARGKEYAITSHSLSSCEAVTTACATLD